MSGKYINSDRRSYVIKDYVTETKRMDITEGGFKLVFCPAKNAWITLGGGVIKIKTQAEIYARKVNNYMLELSV